jgi:hypothetical protein
MASELVAVETMEETEIDISILLGKASEGRIMGPDRYELSKFIALTGFIFSFAVILATMAK